MPHPQGRKQHTRQRIVAAASRLFTARGYEATSIDDVMRACHLTRGGFYAHFRSKGALYLEAMEHAAASGRVRAPQGLQLLAIDAAHTVPEVRQGYRRILQAALGGVVGAGDADIGGGDMELAIAAMQIGVMAIAATVDGGALPARLVRACDEAARRLRPVSLDDELASDPFTLARCMAGTPLLDHQLVHERCLWSPDALTFEASGASRPAWH